MVLWGFLKLHDYTVHFYCIHNNLRVGAVLLVQVSLWGTRVKWSMKRLFALIAFA